MQWLQTNIRKYAPLYVGWKIASLARQHNDANIISIPARYTSIPQAVEMVETFINTAFEGGRHKIE
jgi:ribose 5-phosphate isomerase RpiB